MDLVVVVDEDDKSVFNLSSESIMEQLSKDSEGFQKCRTHMNQQGLVVPITPKMHGFKSLEDE